MNELSAYRGASGEVVRGFVRPATLFTCLPVMVCTFALGAFGAMIVAWTGMPSWMAMAVSVATTAPVVGLFAMSARAGAFSAGFFEALTEHRSGVPGFVLRFSAIGIPLAAVAGLAMERMTKVSMMSPAGMTAGLLWLGVLLFAGLLGPSLGLLVAARAESVGEALSPQAWGWAAFDRRADLPAYFASAIGGLLLFWMLSLPLVAVVGLVAATMDPRLGMVMAGVAWAAPFAASPILLGRLAGAFAAGDYLDETDLGPRPARPSGLAPRPTAPTSPSSPTPAAPTATGAPGRAASPSPGAGAAPATAAAPASPKPAAAKPAVPPIAVSAAGTSLERRTPVNIAVQRIEERAADDPGGALRDAEALAEQEPRSAAAHALHARLAHDAGLALEARAAAGRAIPLAFETGAGAVAVELFLHVSAQANKLQLPSATWLQLGKALGARSHDAAAHWCLRAAGATGGDEIAVDKARIQLAESALEGGRVEEAVKIYEAFLADRADSSLADFAREGAELARRRLPAGVS